MDPRFEGKYSIKSAQKLAIVANRCLARNPKSRPMMSEVLEMVNRIIDPSTETVVTTKPALTSLVPTVDVYKVAHKEKASEETERKGERGNMDLKNGEDSWLACIWSSKLVKAR